MVKYFKMVFFLWAFWLESWLTLVCDPLEDPLPHWVYWASALAALIYARWALNLSSAEEWGSGDFLGQGLPI
jgi:hypothetical protein